MTSDKAQSKVCTPAGNTGRLEGFPEGFDVVAWTREACERSGVSFAVTDPLVLDRLGTLARFPAASAEAA